jgi:hypothetical protein
MNNNNNNNKNDNKNLICVHNNNKYRCHNCPYRMRYIKNKKNKKISYTSLKRKRSIDSHQLAKNKKLKKDITSIPIVTGYDFPITPDNAELLAKLIILVGEELTIPDSYMEFPPNEYLNFDHGTWPIHRETLFKVNSRIMSINKVCALFKF